MEKERVYSVESNLAVQHSLEEIFDDFSLVITEEFKSLNLSDLKPEDFRR